MKNTYDLENKIMTADISIELEDMLLNLLPYLDDEQSKRLSDKLDAYHARKKELKKKYADGQKQIMSDFFATMKGFLSSKKMEAGRLLEDRSKSKDEEELKRLELQFQQSI